MKKCPKCGHKVKDTATFCGNCGAKLSGGRYLQKGKKNRKILFISIGILLVVIFCLCILKSEELLAHIMQDNSLSIEPIKSERINDARELSKTFNDRVSQEVTDIIWNGDIGTAYVTVTAPDLEKVVSMSVQQVSEKYQNEDSDTLLCRAREIAQEILESDDCPIIETTIEVTAEKTKSGYDLIPNQELENAISGNIETIYIKVLLEGLSDEAIK